MEQVKIILLKQWSYGFLFCDLATFPCLAGDFLTFGFGVTLLGSSSFSWGSTSSYCIGLMITPGFLTI
jgi:hypothetical protein